MDITTLRDLFEDHVCDLYSVEEQILEALPKAVIACPGNGINANLVDKARKLGIKVWSIEKGG